MHVANGASVANPGNGANAVLRRVAVPSRRDAAVLRWPGLFATNSLALGALGKGVWTATARPGNAFQIIEGPRRPSLTDRGKIAALSLNYAGGAQCRCLGPGGRRGEWGMRPQPRG